LENDIAIIKLNQDLILNNEIQVACLPTKKSSNYPDVNVTKASYAVGWGKQSALDQSISKELRNVQLKLYDMSKCSIYATESAFNTDSTTHICSGDIENGLKNICNGDSGGGLYVIDTIGGNRDKLVLSGITSYTYSCGYNKVPSVFTRVSEYLDWIEEQNRIEWPDLEPYPDYIQDDLILLNKSSRIKFIFIYLFSSLIFARTVIV
jgi:elastase-2